MKVYKKVVSSVLFLMVSLILLSSCSTTVTVSYLQPAKFDLTQYKKLAISSMKVTGATPFSQSYVTVQYDNFEDTLFTGFDRRIASNVAEEFTDSLYNDLYKTSYFELIKPVITDGYINNFKYGIKSIEKLKDLGAQALLISELNYLDYQEYQIVGDYKKIINPDYAQDSTQSQYINSSEKEVTIIQQASVKFSYKVIDINSGEIIASQSFTKTLTNEVEYDEDLIVLPSMEPLFKHALLDGESQIVKDLSPQYISTNITLKSDKSHNTYFDAGFEASKKGSLKVAYDNFNKAWNTYNMYSAGYNSALVLESLGERESAIERMKEVYNSFNDMDSYEQLSRMEQYKYDTNVAKNQINN